MHLFAFVYPFIATVKCISDDNTKKGGEATSDSTDWLMYWGKQRLLVSSNYGYLWLAVTIRLSTQSSRIPVSVRNTDISRSHTLTLQYLKKQLYTDYVWYLPQLCMVFSECWIHLPTSSCTGFPSSPLLSWHSSSGAGLPPLRVRHIYLLHSAYHKCLQL